MSLTVPLLLLSTEFRRSRLRILHYNLWNGCKLNFQYVHGVDHQVPYTSLEGHIGSVGGLLHFCGNTTEENSLQVDGLVVGQCGLPLGLLVHLNSKRPETDKNPSRGLNALCDFVGDTINRHTTCQEASLYAASALVHRSGHPGRVA